MHKLIQNLFLAITSGTTVGMREKGGRESIPALTISAVLERTVFFLLALYIGLLDDLA